MDNPAPILSAEDVSRIIDHMNDDHADSVLAYVRHFAQLPEASAARLLSVDHHGMDIEAEISGGKRRVRVAFDPVLVSAHDAHMTMVRMSREAMRG